MKSTCKICIAFSSGPEVGTHLKISLPDRTLRTRALKLLDSGFRKPFFFRWFRTPDSGSCGFRTFKIFFSFNFSNSLSVSVSLSQCTTVKLINSQSKLKIENSLMKLCARCVGVLIFQTFSTHVPRHSSVQFGGRAAESSFKETRSPQLKFYRVRIPDSGLNFSFI